MALIFNADGSDKSRVTIQLDPNGVGEFQYLIACRDGYELSSEAITGVSLMARKNGDATWIDLEATPIDLSSDAGSDVLFDFQITAGPSATIVQCPIRVGPA